jgi:POT family proton-dependent oligopeptide transporter
MATMPIYTNLFFWLGVAGVACTVVAVAVLPLMKRLSAEHASGQASQPTVGSEQ